MYGNIDINEAVTFITNYHKSETETVRRRLHVLLLLAKWVNNNCILFANNIVYKQIKGLAMGTPMAPTVARLFACCVEGSNHFQVNLSSESYSNNLKAFLKTNNLSTATTKIFRYIDDGFAIFNTKVVNNTFLDDSDRKDLLLTMSQSLHNIYSNCNSINVTVEYSSTGLEAVMLDLTCKVVTVDIKRKGFNVEPYDKPTNKHLYAHPSSYYPDRYIFNWINGENQRLIRNSSTETSYIEALSNFTSHLLSREYPLDIAKAQLEKHSYSERYQLLYPSSESSKDTTKSKQVYLKNIPGRHLIEQLGRDIVRLNGDSTPFTWITLKGSNLLGEVSKHNKEALSSSTH